MPTPPLWFLRELRKINPYFGARFNAEKEVWEITEAVRHARRSGQINGSPLFIMRRKSECALRVKELGERWLAYVRRNDPRKYNSIAKMVDALKIDEQKMPQMQQTFV